MAHHTPGPWFLSPKDWTMINAPDSDPSGEPTPWEIARVCLYVGYHQELPDAEAKANARLLAAAPAFAMAWKLVPDEIKGRIFDALHKPDTAWIEESIARAERTES